MGTKFRTTLNLPNVFELDKYTSRVVEQQYLDNWQDNYNETVETVRNYSRVHKQLVRQLPNLGSTQAIKRARMYLSEEVYNPLFKFLVMQGQSLSGESSAVVQVLQNQGEQGLEVLAQASREANDTLTFLTPEVHNKFMQRVRNVVRTFPFQAYNVPKVQF